MAEVPSTMRSLVAPKKGTPDVYEVRQVPTPKLRTSTQVLIRVHAAGINTGDVQLAGGQVGVIYTAEFPMSLGFEGAGVVVATGKDVSSLKVGDEVFGTSLDKPMFRDPPPGFASEYTVCEEHLLLKKPRGVDFETAASIPTLVTTAYLAISRGLRLSGEPNLEGKTVFVPGALSGTGSIMVQIAKNVFGASRIISTVSTPKISLVEQHLPGIVDQLIDYKIQSAKNEVPPASVDFAINTQWTTLDECIHVLKPQTGTLMSITGIPTKETTKELIGADSFPCWLGATLDAGQMYYEWKLWGTNIQFEMISGDPEKRDSLHRAGEMVSQGKVKPVVRVANLDDIEAVRENCSQVYTGKGGLGKFVVRIV
ncbi:unnamed protein product [Clonostachys rosea]|uniref:Enoyl reductase (ER) domain-containing protein n=1 Tax=Bionectria ochroleuca TaxID=29856 RepID=A0ABY6U338_BIOOC|nr:unnamed protein product [Clonostachys rosea]